MSDDITELIKGLKPEPEKIEVVGKVPDIIDPKPRYGDRIKLKSNFSNGFYEDTRGYLIDQNPTTNTYTAVLYKTDYQVRETRLDNLTRNHFYIYSYQNKKDTWT